MKASRKIALLRFCMDFGLLIGITLVGIDIVSSYTLPVNSWKELVKIITGRMLNDTKTIELAYRWFFWHLILVGSVGFIYGPLIMIPQALLYKEKKVLEGKPIKVSEKALIAFVFLFALSLTIYVSLSLPHPFKALEQREKLLIEKGLITSPIEIYPIFGWKEVCISLLGSLVVLSFFSFFEFLRTRQKEQTYRYSIPYLLGYLLYSLARGVKGSNSGKDNKKGRRNL
jgi:hypothetical protein